MIRPGERRAQREAGVYSPRGKAQAARPGATGVWGTDRNSTAMADRLAQPDCSEHPGTLSVQGRAGAYGVG